MATPQKTQINKFERVDYKVVIGIGVVALIAVQFISRPSGNTHKADHQAEISKLTRKSDSLLSANKILKDSLNFSQERTFKLNHQVDSLSKIPSQIKSKYEKRYEKIKTLNADSLSGMFKVILADGYSESAK